MADFPDSSWTHKPVFVVRALQILEEILQAELDQSRRHRSLCDDAEVCSPKIRAGIGELRVIEGIVELRTERQLCVFPEAPDRGRFADRKIRIKLSRSVDDALTGISIAQRPVGPDGGSSTNGRRINPIMQSRAGSTGGYQISVCRAWAKSDCRGSREAIDRASFAVGQRYRCSTLHNNNSGNRPAAQQGALKSVGAEAGQIVAEVGDQTVSAIEIGAAPIQIEVPLIVVNRGIGFGLGKGISKLKSHAVGNLLSECRLFAMVPAATEKLVCKQARRCLPDDGDAQVGIDGGIRGYAARCIKPQDGKDRWSHTQTSGRIRQPAVYWVARSRQKRLVGAVKE